MKYISKYPSPVGGMTMASDGKALTGLWFDGQKYFGAGLSDSAEEKSLPVFEETARWLDIYFSGKNPDFTPPLKFYASDFRCKVWSKMLEIPFGKTETYGGLAAGIAPTGENALRYAHAVGSAVGHNPILIIVPCHRLIGRNGSLTGYAGGIDKKQYLLSLEKIDTSGFFIPKKSSAP